MAHGPITNPTIEAANRLRTQPEPQSEFEIGKSLVQSQQLTPKSVAASVSNLGLGKINERDLLSNRVQQKTFNALSRIQKDVDAGRTTVDAEFNKALQKKGLSTGEKIALGTLAILPTLVGGAVSGFKGAAIGAQVGTKASLGFLGSVQTEREGLRKVQLEKAKAKQKEVDRLGALAGDITKTGFKKDLDIIAPAASGKELKFRIRIPRRDGGPGSEIVDVIRGVDGSIRTLDRRIVPDELLRVSQTGLKGRTRIDRESGGVVINDSFSEGGLLRLRDATLDELRTGVVNAPPGIGGTQTPTTEQVKKEAPKRPAFPSALDNLADLSPSEDPRIAALLKEETNLEAQLNPSLLTGETVIQRDVRIKNTEAKLKNVRGDIDKRETEFEKNRLEALKTQAAAADANRRILRIFDLKRSVNTGFIRDASDAVLNKFNSSTVEERERLRQATAQNLAEFMKSISGAAISEPEAKRLKKIIPTMDKDDVTFRAVLSEFARAIENTRRRGLEGVGIFAPAGEGVGADVFEQQGNRRRLELLEKKRQFEQQRQQGGQ